MPQPPRRSSNKRRIERRASSWARGQKRKKQRRDDNEVQQMENKERDKAGEDRPWKKAQDRRFRLRHRKCRMGAACKVNPEFMHTATNVPLWKKA